MTNIKQKLKKRLKDKKGSMLIEYVIGLLLFVVFVAFCLDVVFIGHKHYYIGQEMANVQRTISVQSGTELVTPQGFPGGDKAYQTSKEMMDRMGKVADAAGFEEGEWEIFIEEKDQNGNVVRSGLLKEDSNFQAEYLNKITIQFRGKYSWDILKAGVPGISDERTMVMERIAMAEYLRKYD